MGLTDRKGAHKREIWLAASRRWQDRSEIRTSAEATTATLGPGSADTPVRQARFVARRNALATAGRLRMEGRLPVFIERKIGPTLDWLDAAPSEAARLAGRPVARIITSADPNLDAYGFATGFMISPSILLTNQHVFPDAASASGTGANFLHELGDQGVQRGVTFELDPTSLFYANEALDFSVTAVKPVAVTGETLSSLGFVTPTEATSKILVGMPMRMIEHPDGGAKRYAFQNCRLLDVLDDGFLQYETDTDEGSSGSPCFSDAWELCGVHHASIPKTRGNEILCVDGTAWSEGRPEADIEWIANEGIRISAVIRALAKYQASTEVARKLLAELMAGTTDPADDIARLLPTIVTESGPLRPTMDLTRHDAAQEVRMDGVTMTFTGPVTINVNSAGPTGLSFAAPAAIPLQALEKSLRFDPDYAARKGYSPDFLGNGIVVEMPGVSASRDEEMYRVDGTAVVLDYHHFSLAMNRNRRMQMWSAANIDYDPEKRKVSGRATFGTDRWIGDPRIPAEFQLQNPDVYGPAGQVDRGHIVRREDNAWGETPEETEFANSDTFHWTNCTPQHAAFNREQPGTPYAGVKGIWGGFEGHIQKNLQHDDTRACILAGPVHASDDAEVDFGTGPVRVPTRFWKVVVVADRSGDQPAAAAYGFILSQKDVVDRFGVEFAPGEYARFAVALKDISEAAGVTFSEALLDADRLGTH